MPLENEIQRLFGTVRKGHTNIVVVAPHAAGPDMNTGQVAEELARNLGAYLVINYIHHKRKHNFNDLRQMEKQDENGKKPMKEFYNCIDKLAEEAKQHAKGLHKGKKRTLIVYVHGMADRDDLGVDIGIGVKWNPQKQKYQGAEYHPKAGTNTGKVQANFEMTKTMRRMLDAKLKTNMGLRALIGSYKPAWDKNNGIQHHAKTDNHAIQVEINKTLRFVNNGEYIAKQLAKAIRKAYWKL